MYLEALTVLLGILMSLAYYPQAWKIWRSKSSRDVSLLSYVIFAVGTLVWTIYGLALANFVIVASFTVGVLGSWLVLGLALYYRRPDPAPEVPPEA